MSLPERHPPGTMTAMSTALTALTFAAIIGTVFIVCAVATGRAADPKNAEANRRRTEGGGE